MAGGSMGLSNQALDVQPFLHLLLHSFLSSSLCYIFRSMPDATLPSREDAWKLVCEFTQSESLRKHMLAVETCVRAYAKKSGADENLWGLAALLHDFDYEKFPNNAHSAD